MRSPRWALLAVPALVIAAIVAFVATRGDELPRSETCDRVEPGGSQLRSASPPTPADGAGSATSASVDRAFQAGTAEAIHCQDLADPYVLRVDEVIGERLFVYGTETGSMHVPVLTAAGLFGRPREDDALPTLPAWSSGATAWAPAVLTRGDVHVLYYTTTDRASGRQCISAATSTDPGGPFVDRSSAPLVCPVGDGGAIDPSPFVSSDGRAFLLWKNDGNCCGIPTRIFTQTLSDDGLSLTAAATELLRRDQDWEGSVIEAPAMVQHGDRLYLFYSGNAWNSSSYAIGYAVCATPTGPCSKPQDGPWLASSHRAAGPGGAELFTDGDGWRMVFSAWTAGKVGYAAGGFRSLYTVRIEFVDGVPVTAT